MVLWVGKGVLFREVSCVLTECSTVHTMVWHHQRPKTISQNNLSVFDTVKHCKQQQCTDSNGDQRCLTLNRQTQRQRMQSVASMTAKMAPPTHTPATRMIGRPVADSSSAREEK